MINYITFDFEEINTKLNNEGKEKKDLKNLPNNWQNLEQSYHRGYDCFGVLTGKKNDIIVLDFDDKNYYNEFCNKYNEINNTYIVATKNGFHVYLKWNDKFEKLNKNYIFGEILKNNCFAIKEGTKYKILNGETIEYKKINNNNPIEMSDKLFNDLINGNYNKYEKINNNNNNDNKKYKNITFENEYWREILNNINIIYWDDYNHWFKILCGFHKLQYDLKIDLKKICKEYSQQSQQYTDEGFKNYWIKSQNYYNNYTPATLKYYSRISNEENYIKINKNALGDISIFFAYNEILLSEYFLNCYDDNIIVNKNKIYVYHKNKWIHNQDGTIIKYNIAECISNLYKNLYEEYNKKHLQDFKNKDLQEKTQTLYKLYNSFGNQKIQNIYGIIKNKIMANNINVEVFDTNTYLFAFSNKVYDFKNNNFRNIEKDDYILTTTNRDWVEPTLEQIQTIKDIINNIFPDEEMQKTYISIMRSGLVGIRVDKFNVMSGGGRNGKGVINDLLKELCGDYFHSLPIAILTKELKDHDSSLRKLHNARIIKFTEPDNGTNEKLRISNIKTLTGESTLKCRDNYESSIDMIILATYLMECNTKPNINFENNEAEGQRFNVVDCKITFTDDDNKIKQNPNLYKKINREYSTIEWRLEHRCAFFKYLIDSNETKLGEIYINEESKRLTQDWFNSCNIIYNWFMDKCEYQKGETIKFKKLYDEYKTSDIFYSATKAERRAMTYKKFREIIKTKLKTIPHIKFTTNKDCEFIENYMLKDDEEY